MSPTVVVTARVVVGAERDDDLVGPDGEQLRVVDHDRKATARMGAMTIERHEPAYFADERTMLDAWLEYHRATLALKCEGSTDDQLRLRRSAVEHVAARSRPPHGRGREATGSGGAGSRGRARLASTTTTNPDGDFDDVDTADVDEAFAYWQDECANARDDRAVVRLARRLSAHHTRSDADVSLRWVLVHMIEEYARHNGHADLLRERIDGATGD